jgi:hypothetical protein
MKTLKELMTPKSDDEILNQISKLKLKNYNEVYEKIIESMKFNKPEILNFILQKISQNNISNFLFNHYFSFLNCQYYNKFNDIIFKNIKEKFNNYEYELLKNYYEYKKEEDDNNISYDDEYISKITLIPYFFNVEFEPFRIQNLENIDDIKFLKYSLNKFLKKRYINKTYKFLLEKYKLGLHQNEELEFESYYINIIKNGIKEYRIKDGKYIELKIKNRETNKYFLINDYKNMWIDNKLIIKFSDYGGYTLEYSFIYIIKKLLKIENLEKINIQFE